MSLTVTVVCTILSEAMTLLIGYRLRVFVEEYRRRKVQSKLSLAEKQVHNTVAGKKLEREITNKMNRWSDMLTQRQAENLEMFAAAYYKHGDLPPDQVELVQEIINHEKVVWYFQPKREKAS